MEHLPFEGWILADAPLTSEQSHALANHLAACPRCQQIQIGWLTARGRIRAAGLAAPAPNFTARWQAGLAERRAHAQNLQVRRTLLFLVTAGLAAFAVSILWILAGSSPVDWAVRLLSFFLRTATTLSDAVTFISSWLNALPKTIPLAIWIYLSSVFALLALGWLFTLWRVMSQGVTTK